MSRSFALAFLTVPDLGPTEAIRDKLSRDTKAIAEVASPATLARRKLAAENPSAPWVQRKYGGGRTGFKAPDQTVRLFNDSGRLADGFFVRDNKEDGSFTVNVPKNRFDPSTFDGAGFERMLERFRSLMPVLQDSRALLSDPAFNTAVTKAVAGIVNKGEMGDDAATVSRLRALSAARKRAALAALNALRGAAGL